MKSKTQTVGLAIIAIVGVAYIVGYLALHPLGRIIMASVLG